MQKGIERRFARAWMAHEKRADQKDAMGYSEVGILTGHAAVFGMLSEDLSYFRERIDKGAFEDSIAKDDVRALFNHDPNFILGRTGPKTLRMREDDRGLYVEIDLPDTQLARDLAVSIGRGDVSQMSFAFETIMDAWDFTDRDNPIRTLKKVRLYDVSPVTYPAYADTDVEVALRSMNDARAQLAPPLPPVPYRLLLRKRKMALTA